MEWFKNAHTDKEASKMADFDPNIQTILFDMNGLKAISKRDC